MPDVTTGAGGAHDTPVLRVTILGARGSAAVSGPEYAEFGGATSCYLVEAGEERVILDAGTGIIKAPTAGSKPSVILVSHSHLDHLAGLGMYSRLSQAGAKTLLYLPAPTAGEARTALERLYSPPLWPLPLTSYAGELEVAALPDDLPVGDVRVTTVEGHHPGGCKIIKLSRQGKSLVYATDYECEPASYARLVECSREADLVLLDGQFSPEELPSRTGFGHATPLLGLDLLRDSGAKQLLVIHHDPAATDEVLRERERRLADVAAGAPIRFAREGEVIEL